jgi:hypothetical protein
MPLPPPAAGDDHGVVVATRAGASGSDPSQWGWLNRPFRWATRQHQVFMIRLGSSVFGIVKLREAWCDNANQWGNGLIPLKELEREHQEIFRLGGAGEIFKA